MCCGSIERLGIAGLGGSLAEIGIVEQSGSTAKDSPDSMVTVSVSSVLRGHSVAMVG